MFRGVCVCWVSLSAAARPLAHCRVRRALRVVACGARYRAPNTRGPEPRNWAVSSAGRASRLHREGRRFEPVTAHHALCALFVVFKRYKSRPDFRDLRAKNLCFSANCISVCRVFYKLLQKSPFAIFDDLLNNYLDRSLSTPGLEVWASRLRALHYIMSEPVSVIEFRQKDEIYKKIAQRIQTPTFWDLLVRSSVRTCHAPPRNPFYLATY